MFTVTLDIFHPVKITINLCTSIPPAELVMGFKISYQFRWRDASSQLYGNFEWVEDVKSYSKHEFWLEFSYKFITDILY